MFDRTSQADNQRTTDTETSYYNRPPTVSLPKGGGAITGIGEKFTANPVTGTGSMSVPIATSPSRSGFGPQLSISYDSGAGNSVFGFGWNLSIPSITRKTDKGLPRYFDANESDIFILSGTEDLVPVLNAGGDIDEMSKNGYRIRKYRPRIEGLFARIERWTDSSSGEIHWRSISRNNITTLYGQTSESRIADSTDSSKVFSWLICESYDDKGNVIRYRYKAEDSEGETNQGITISHAAHERNRTKVSRSVNRYLKSIQYGNQTPRQPNEDLSQRTDWMFEVVFDYGEHIRFNDNNDLAEPTPNDSNTWTIRNDPFSFYRAGFEIRTYRLCQRVLMFHHFPNEVGVGQNCLVGSTDFHYSYEEFPTRSTNPIYSKLVSVSHRGYTRKLGGGYTSKSWPPLEFTYSEPEIGETVRAVDQVSLENLPEGLDGARYRWVDLDGEGLSGILTEQGDGWFYKRNVSPAYTVRENGSERSVVKFSAIESIVRKPALALKRGGQFLDLAGDGQLDLADFRTATPGFYKRSAAAEWEAFEAFKTLPVVDWDSPNLRFIDLNGDGHSDILMTEDHCFVWYASLTEDGFGEAQDVTQPWDEEEGPRLVSADSTQSIHLADLSGDGLVDIVRIRNGEVCYWPNLGYGRFGAKVTMDHSPWFDLPDCFDQRRLVLADIDGSGTTDIVYLSDEGAHLYFNQSGNSWSPIQIVQSFPSINNVSSVTAVDLLGNGTVCLVWSTSLPSYGRKVMQYIDLMSGQKPHLLIKTVNNLGAETVISYAPSTKFYVQDKLAGKPWLTKLPFPVQVVENVSVSDKWRQARFTSTYSYHHGYFDGREREFRGFGRVEQTDVEDFGTFTAGNRASPYISENQTLYQPPVKTITWFHTGAFLDRTRILSQFADEYFPTWYEVLNPNEMNILGDFQEHRLPEPDFRSENLRVEEWREALRACKGMMLRQEVYELDVDALEQGEERRVTLFSTAFHTCHIQKLQSRGDNRYPVFLVTESEAITYHYDLDLQADALVPDPRILHTLHLQIDEYGNVLESVTVSYPRIRQQGVETMIEEADTLINQVQQERHLIYTENHFTHDVTTEDDYRLRVPSERKTYELTGLVPTSGMYYTLAELRRAEIANGVLDIPYHITPNHLTPQKRLVEWQRTLYFNDDLQTPLPWGELNALGLIYETYKLALTEALLDAIFDPEQLTSEVRNGLDNGELSGYLSGPLLAEHFPDMDTSGQYWIRSGIAGFTDNPAEHFYLPERYIDPFGAITTLVYDVRDLFVESSTDSIGNTVQITQFDFRVLAPAEIRDINNNLSRVYFDGLGLPTAMAVMGKGDRADSLASFREGLANPNWAELHGFFVENDYDELQARTWLERATVRYVYYFGEQQHDDGTTTWGEHPACACSIMRERHTDDNSPLQVAFAYTDGMGMVIVNKVQAEPETENGPLRWIAGGKTIFNNKGNPVKQYEPYFSQNDLGEPNHRFEEPQELGVTHVLYYDAVGRLVRTEIPDGTYSRVSFSPWLKATYDENDTVLEPGNDWHTRYSRGTVAEQRTARLAEIHADTPTITHLDSLGREVVEIAHNRWQRDNVATEERYLTYTKLDIEGKPLWIQDMRGNRVMEYINSPGADTEFVPCYDIAGNLLFQHSGEGGDRWILMDATGQTFYSWDENEWQRDTDTLVVEHRRFHTVYDTLRRPVEQHLKIEDNMPQMIERVIYGEGQPDEVSRNLRGQVYQHYDSSGIVTNQQFDFKGNALEVTRQLVRDYKASVIDWIEGSPTNSLEAQIFTTRTEYDALNRPTLLIGPDQSIIRPVYNEANLLNQVHLRVRGADSETVFVQNIDYDAKGQRQQIEYGNGVQTTYTYDPETFGLVRLLTTRLSDNARLQDLHYTYDPVGNIAEIRDEAQQTTFFNNAVVSPSTRYEYDALYRLIRAEGREHAGQQASPQLDHQNVPMMPLPHPNEEQAMRNYTEHYEYDGVGNILAMIHRATNGNWTRRYQYAADNNRLLATSRPGDGEREFSSAYTYDTHGNMTTMPHLALMQWNYRDYLKATSRQVVHEGTPETTYYVYDGSGQRVRKVTERQASVGENSTRRNERLYLGGFEIYREYGGDGETVLLERETLHVMDNQQRIALVETKTIDTENTSETPLLSPTLRYQLGNHLGSASLEVDADGAVISYEEYHPYGTSAYRSGLSIAEISLKRYRYTGMERDEETKLGYHGARYYAPWLGKWVAVDPIGIKDDLNVYHYVRNNPIILIDESGEAPKSKSGKGRRIARKFAEEVGKASIDVTDEGHGSQTPDKGTYEVFSESQGDKERKRSQAEQKARKEIRTEPTPSKDRSTVDPNATGGIDSPTHLDKQTVHDRGDLQIHEGDFDGKRGTHLVEVPDVETKPNKIATIPEPFSFKKTKEAAAEGLTHKLGKIIGEGGAKILPGAGSAVGVGFVLKALEEGRYGEGLLDAVGLIPVVGDVVDVGVTFYEATRVVDEHFGITDKIVDFIGFPEEVEALPEAYRKEVKRGSPGFLKPKPKPKPKPPTENFYFEEEHHVTPFDDFVGPRLPEYLDIKNARIS